MTRRPRIPLGKTRLWFIAAIVLGLLGDTAFAGGADVTPRRMAHPDIRGLASTERPDGVWRAIIASEWGVPYLVVEQFARGRIAHARDLPTLQRRVDGFRFGRGTLTFSGQAAAIDSLRWTPRALKFDVVTASERLACRLPTHGSNAFVARCGADTVGRRHQRPSARANWAADPGVIQACGAAFYGSKNESACLETVSRFSYDPTPAIKACDTHMYGDTNALDCLRQARAATTDPARRLAACDQAMYGDANSLACFAVASRAVFDPVGVIAACDQAMYGDVSALACIETATRAGRDVSGTIQACDDAMYGDDAALQCLRRGVSY